MTIVNCIVGGTTSDSATFVVRATTSPVKVEVADNPQMTDACLSAPHGTDTGGAARVSVGCLEPNTRYWWAAMDSQGTSTVGTFITHPPLGEPASFRFGASGDSGHTPAVPGNAGGELDAARLSNIDTYDVMRAKALEQDWLFFLNLGDWGYPDWGTRNVDTITNRRRWYDDLLAQSRQAAFCSQCAQVYFWDDHCFAGNDSTGLYALKANALHVYKERFPHYPLASPSHGIFQSWQAGRVLFVGADTRYARSANNAPDNATKTMLGQDQKTWMANLLATASNDDSVAALVWVLSSQWMHPTHPDGWKSFQTERNELIQMFGDTGFLSKMVAVSADAHDMFIHSARDRLAVAPYFQSRFPVFHFAGIDAWGIYGAPSDVGTGSNSIANNRRGRRQWGSMHIGDLGGQISIAGTGWRDTRVINRYQFTTR